MEPANTHTLLKRLTAAGFTVTRPATANKRNVALTDAGSALAAKLADKLAQSTDETLAPLDAVERGELVALLRRVVLIDP